MCLNSIARQDYPKDLLEVIVVDAGSRDETLAVVNKFLREHSGIKLRLLSNKMRTGEAGKALGLKVAENEIIALVDSDNVLESEDWLRNMVEPFADREIAGTEPLYYTYRRQDYYITRYCALLGMNDPLCLFLGNYDRYSQLTNKWTGVPVSQEDKGNYVEVELKGGPHPTIGANGFLVRRKLLEGFFDDYLFDVDLVCMLVERGHSRFAKVKIGIVHLFSRSMGTFARKQRRRIRDYYYYRKLHLRKYPWHSLHKGALWRFILFTIFTLPLLAQAGKGYLRKPDRAWFFHPLACWITLVVYTWATATSLFVIKPEKRERWEG